MRIIINSMDDPVQVTKAALRAIKYRDERWPLERSDDTDILRDMGLRMEGKCYSVRFNKNSVSVWRNE